MTQTTPKGNNMKKLLTITTGVLLALILFAAGCTALVGTAIDDIELEWSCPPGTEHEMREFVTRENSQGQTEGRWANTDEWHVIAEDGFAWSFTDQCGEYDLDAWMED
jgi:hypothetical protein